MFHPPGSVVAVMACVRLFLSDEPKVDLSWKASLVYLQRMSFFNEIMSYDMERTPRHLNKALQFLDLKEFDAEVVGKVSKGAKGLCIWCRFLLVILRLQQWLRPKELELEARREASKEAERIIYDKMHGHSDLRPVADARRAELQSEGPVQHSDEHGELERGEHNLPELPLIRAAEVSTLADIDREIARLLRLDDASAEQSRALISKLGKSRNTLLKSVVRQASFMPSLEELKEA